MFDYKVGDVFGCMAVLGWITGHSYVVYGPLCNGATTVLYESTATHPDSGKIRKVTYQLPIDIDSISDRYWKAIQNHKINQFYVTPSVCTQLMRGSTDNFKNYDLSSLKTVATGTNNNVTRTYNVGIPYY